MISAEDEVNIVDSYYELGSYRAAARVCGVDHHTVARAVERHRKGETGQPRRPVSREHNYDAVAGLVAAKVKSTDGRISAKRLLPLARAEGYDGSARNFRRLVAAAKTEWRRDGRLFRPWRPAPGEFLAIDYGTWQGWQIFCAVLMWSRIRFVRISRDQTRATTLALLAECFETLGGVPAVVLADRIACLRGPIVAGRVVAHPDYVRFAGHYGFRPDWCEAADPQSKGVVENLVGYAKSDLVVPSCDGWVTLTDANTAAAAWCAEVNAIKHSEIAAVPMVRLAEEVKILRPLPSLRPALVKGVSRKVDRLATIRIGSARYSVPATLIGTRVWVAATSDAVTIRTDEEHIVAQHPLVAPGEVAICDDHYGGPRTTPRRAVRPRTATEKAFLDLGEPAEAFLRAAAAAGQTRLPAHLAGIVELAAAHGAEVVIAALGRALTFRRFTADDVRSIIAAGPDAPLPAAEGVPLTGDLPDRTPATLEAFTLDRLTRKVTS
jgi:transposase